LTNSSISFSNFLVSLNIDNLLFFKLNISLLAFLRRIIISYYFKL